MKLGKEKKEKSYKGKVTGSVILEGSHCALAYSRLGEVCKRNIFNIYTFLSHSRTLTSVSTNYFFAYPM